MKRLAYMLLLAGCGGEAPPIVVTTQSLLPIALGNRWEYRVTESGSPEVTKVQTVAQILQTDLGEAFEFISETGLQKTVSIQRLDGTKLVRDSEIASQGASVLERIRFDPAALRVDTKPQPLNTRVQTVTSEQRVDESGNAIGVPTSKDTTFIIEAVDESVTVPAGTFSTTRIRKTTVGGATKTYWYALGVGKVMEVGGQTESLASFTVEPETP